MTYRSLQPKHRYRWQLLLPALLLVPLMACKTAAQVDVREPKVNPSPKQLIRVHGRMPKSLEVSFVAQYAISDDAFKNVPECRPRAINGEIPLMADLMRQEEMQIKRVGDHYETQLIVDRVLPGLCGWAFTEATAYVVKDGKLKDKNYVEITEPAPVRKRFEQTPENCATFGGGSCPEVANSDPTPVLVRCEMFKSQIKLDKPPSLYCSSYEIYKQTHFIADTTRAIEINFYDLTIDADPIQAATTQGERK